MQQQQPELTPPGSATDPLSYFKAIAGLRDFIWGYASGRLRSSRADMVLGNLWLILEPATLVAVYYLVFQIIFDRGTGNFIAFLAIGQTVFGYGRRLTTQTASSLLRAENLLRSFTHPHMVFPLADALHAMFSLFFSSVVLLALLVVTGEAVRWSWLWFPIILVLITFAAGGMGLAVARWMAQVSDIQILLEYLFRLLLFLSGVFWSVDRMVTGPNAELFGKLFALNPFYCGISASRWALIGLEPTQPVWVIGSLITSAVLAMVVGGFLFVSGERRYSGRYRVVTR